MFLFFALPPPSPTRLQLILSSNKIGNDALQTATNPLDRIRMLSQTGEHGGTSRTTNVVHLYRNILRNEGVLGLWAGNGANLLRVFPAKAVVFSSNDFYRQIIQKYIVGGDPAHQQLSGAWSFLAGGLAGMSASMATYPLDLAVRWE